MKIYSMLYGLTNRDFSVIGTLAGTAAKSALVNGMMYPLTEVAYGTTNKVIDAVLPKGARQPLPNGFKPQELKNDPTNTRPTSGEERAIYFNNVAKYLDGIDDPGKLKSVISTVDPKYSFELYHYLESRGLNPEDYLRKAGDKSKCDSSCKDMATKKPNSTDALKKAIPWAVAGLAATNLMSPSTTDPQLQYQNNQKALRNALFIGGAAWANKMGYLDDFKKSFGWKGDKKDTTKTSSTSNKSSRSNEEDKVVNVRIVGDNDSNKTNKEPTTI